MTEFCEGGDLLHSLNRRAKSQNGPPVMPEPEARTVIGQVAKGVSAIHAAGFIHRDIKEANIFISEGSSHQQVAQCVQVLNRLLVFICTILPTFFIADYVQAWRLRTGDALWPGEHDNVRNQDLHGP